MQEARDAQAARLEELRDGEEGDDDDGGGSTQPDEQKKSGHKKKPAPPSYSHVQNVTSLFPGGLRPPEPQTNRLGGLQTD